MTRLIPLISVTKATATTLLPSKWSSALESGASIHTPGCSEIVKIKMNGLTRACKRVSDMKLQHFGIS